MCIPERMLTIMKLKTKHLVLVTIAICFAITMVVGSNFTVFDADTAKAVKNTKDTTKETMLTKEVVAGSATFMRNTSVTDEDDSKKMVADVAVAAGSATVETATIEDKEVPVVAADDSTGAATEVTEEAVETAAQPEEDEWSGKVMAKVQESANIRANANEDGELVGHLPQGAAADIIEKGDEWTQISSGTVVGYVKNDYLAFNDEAKQIADSLGKVATVTTETLRVRKEASSDSEVVTLASVGDSLKVVSEDASWVAVTADDVTGYVASEFVSVSYNLGSATSIEEEKAAEEAKKAAEEKAAKKAAEKEAKAESKSKQVETTQREAVEVSTDDATLLGALIQVEAGGQSYECQLAVASVIINRVNSSRFPDSISGVIYQSGQFPGAHNGKVARVLSNGVKSSCMNAANEALSGANNIGSYLFFNTSSAVSKSRLNDYTVIDGECFY